MEAIVSLYKIRDAYFSQYVYMYMYTNIISTHSTTQLITAECESNIDIAFIFIVKSLVHVYSMYMYI